MTVVLSFRPCRKRDLLLTLKILVNVRGRKFGRRPAGPLQVPSTGHEGSMGSVGSVYVTVKGGRGHGTGVVGPHECSRVDRLGVRPFLLFTWGPRSPVRAD